MATLYSLIHTVVLFVVVLVSAGCIAAFQHSMVIECQSLIPVVNLTIEMTNPNPKLMELRGG